jgi:hypothetical protein
VEPVTLRRAVIVAIAVAAALAGWISAAAPAVPASQGLRTGIFDPLAAHPSSRSEYARIRAAGATIVRVQLSWANVAPANRKPSFAAANPSDPSYRWRSYDAEVRAAASAGVQVMFDIVDTPAWALKRGTTSTPIASDLGAFAHAAALHFDGHHGVPRVRYWQVWNEPNLATQLAPQLVNGRPVGAVAYRAMLNAVWSGVKAVARDNVVVSGGLAPFRDETPATRKQDPDWGPLSFTRAVFCLSPTLRSACSAKVHVDAWAQHPYTSGGPTHHAVLANDVSLGDLPKLVATLRAAVAAGHVLPHRLPEIWVTEFSWDSNPPDPNGVPTELLNRWVPQALYVMWRNDVSVVTWFLLNDQPLKDGIYQSGLRYASGRAKPYLLGFRFPVVAFPRASGFYVWGRTPNSKPATVLVEQRTGAGWHRAAKLHANVNGLFQATVSAGRSGWVRARVGGQASLPFSLASVPDQTFVPFGLPSLGGH